MTRHVCLYPEGMTTAPDTDPRSLPSDLDRSGGSPSAGTGGAGDGVDWLSAHEETVWRRWLAVSSRIPTALSSQLQSDSGLSLQDYDVLVMLNDSDSSSCRITELAGLLDWERSRMSHHLTRMEKLLQDSYVVEHLLSEMDDGMFGELGDEDEDEDVASYPMDIDRAIAVSA